MSKYYVTFGQYNFLIKAGNPYQACIRTLSHKLDKFTDSISKYFRVSHVGFENHEDDLIINLTDIIQILFLSGMYQDEITEC